MRALMTKTLFVLSILLSAQALALDIDGLSYEWIIFEADLKLTGYACCAGGDLYMPPLVVPEDNTYIAAISTIAEKAFFATGVTSVTVVASVTNIESGAFANNTLTSAAFKGDFGNFNPDMFSSNANLTLATITYCEGTTGWPQGFNNGSTIIVTEPVNCPIDGDGDGSADVDDNCPLVSNPQQEDADGDNVGDVCDNCLITPNTDQLDADENGVGDLCTALGC